MEEFVLKIAKENSVSVSNATYMIAHCISSGLSIGDCIEAYNNNGISGLVFLYTSGILINKIKSNISILEDEIETDSKFNKKSKTWKKKRYYD